MDSQIKGIFVSTSQTHNRALRAPTYSNMNNLGSKYSDGPVYY